MKNFMNRKRILVLCLSLVCMTAVFMSRKASAFPFYTIIVDGEEKTFELYAQQKSEQYAKSDFGAAMQADGYGYSASAAAQYASDPGVDHILRVWCGFYPFMFATCEVTSSSLGVFVISTDGRILQHY